MTHPLVHRVRAAGGADDVARAVASAGDAIDRRLAEFARLADRQVAQREARAVVQLIAAATAGLTEHPAATEWERGVLVRLNARLAALGVDRAALLNVPEPSEPLFEAPGRPGSGLNDPAIREFVRAMREEPIT